MLSVGSLLILLTAFTSKLKAITWGLFLECPEMFSHPESRNKISNFMITELFYSHILNTNRGYLHTISFRSILLSVFRYRLIKNGFAGPISFPGLSRNEPLVTYKLSNYKTSRTSATILLIFVCGMKRSIVKNFSTHSSP